MGIRPTSLPPPHSEPLQTVSVWFVFFPRVFYFPLPLQSQCDLSVTLADLGCVGLHISFRPIFCALVSFLLQPSHTALLPAYPQRSFAPWWLSSPSLCISPPNRSANEEHSCSGFHYWTQPIPATIFCIWRKVQRTRLIKIIGLCLVDLITESRDSFSATVQKV